MPVIENGQGPTDPDCLHCKVHALLRAECDKDGGIWDYERLAGQLVQVLAELMASPEQPQERSDLVGRMMKKLSEHYLESVMLFEAHREQAAQTVTRTH